MTLSDPSTTMPRYLGTGGCLWSEAYWSLWHFLGPPLLGTGTPCGCCAHQGRQCFLDRTAALQRKPGATSKDSISPIGFLEDVWMGGSEDVTAAEEARMAAKRARTLQQSWLSDLRRPCFPGGSGRICSSQRACPCIFMASKANTQRITSLQVANDSTDGKAGSSSRRLPERKRWTGRVRGQAERERSLMEGVAPPRPPHPKARPTPARPLPDTRSPPRYPRASGAGDRREVETRRHHKHGEHPGLCSRSLELY